MKSYSFYNKATGLFDGRIFTGSEDNLLINTPDGFSAIEGQYDNLSQKFDTSTRKVVGYKPPKPSDTEFEKFEWNPKSLRWTSYPTSSAIAREARSKRNDLLDKSDWTQMQDVDLDEVEKKKWTAYRKALRDLTLQKDFPSSIVWPIPPSE